VVVVDSEQPAYGEQHDTTVVPAHRGRRLGLRLKADMACWLGEVEPGLGVIRTDNAESNGPMIAVNARLGYQIAGRRLVVQRRL
jgi:RimJ/RimL family protein N-acetyltransferase